MNFKNDNVLRDSSCPDILLFRNENNLDSTNGLQLKPNRAALRLSAKQLLLTKWTAAKPQNKEKQFIVTRLTEPDVPDAYIEMIELEATYSKRSFTLPWRDLKDETQRLMRWPMRLPAMEWLRKHRCCKCH